MCGIVGYIGERDVIEREKVGKSNTRAHSIQTNLYWNHHDLELSLH